MASSARTGSTDLIPRLGFFPTIYSSGYSSPVYNPYALEYQLAGNPFTYSNQVFNTDTTALQTDLTSAIVPEALVTYTPAPVTNIGTNYPDVFKLAPSEYQKARRAESRQSEAGSVMLLTRSGSRPTAYIDISLPASAELYVEGVRTGQAGRRFRRFVSPPLASGQQYAYNVRATWTVNGHQVTQRRRVSVRAGDWVELDFNASRRTR